MLSPSQIVTLDTLAAPWLTPRTAYIHIPFCAHHCGYCDFAVTAGHDHLIDLYVEALTTELAALHTPRVVESLFIGGGTPTHLSAEQLRRVLEAVTQWLVFPNTSPLTSNHSPLTTHEFSIEANPDSLTEEKAAVLAAFCVNRISIGVQSFQAHSLATLDRRHAPEHIPSAIDAARKHIPVVSLDLIFGAPVPSLRGTGRASPTDAPGSTLANWTADLDSAIAFQPQHISTYGLTYEKGTPLWKQRHRGTLLPVAEDDELAMYEHAMDRLAAAGFAHYEISNFARPGFRCRHNERYWANEAYYGFGVGAARYVNGVRELNVRDTQLYIRKVLAGESPTFQREELAPRARAFETMATQLRRSEGIDRARFHEQTGFELDALAPQALALLVDNDIVSDDGLSVRLTRRGKCVADAAVAELLKYNT